MQKQIPLKWLALLLVLWILSYASTYSNNREHIDRMDLFMAAGGRFTQEEGDALERRISDMEQRIMLIEANIGH